MNWEESTEPKRRTLRTPTPPTPDRTWDNWNESTQDAPRERAHWGQTAPGNSDRMLAAFLDRNPRFLCISCDVPACPGCGFGRDAQRRPTARGRQIELFGKGKP